ncbi:MAG TPA: 3-deoxy-manno-octulosonate cytidylyltransferase, partial [Planctomycetes bacterium]|nr:3-deoxy-manno-octulosonate cytidylyltransferase [Planctomycetota bacterium]
MSSVAIVVPARAQSTRLPAKMMLSDSGFPLVVHTAARAREAAASSGGLITRVAVAADSPEITEAAEKHGFQAVLTSVTHQSGTDRIAEAAASMTEDLFVNLQGDEPEMPPATILAMARTLAAGAAPIVTAAYPLNPEHMGDPAVVKVVCDVSGNALYFSRAPIPFLRSDRNAEKLKPLGHFGIYGYTRAMLEGFASWPPGDLEYVEGLEQLRFLERGHRIAVVM